MNFYNQAGIYALCATHNQTTTSTETKHVPADRRNLPHRRIRSGGSLLHYQPAACRLITGRYWEAKIAFYATIGISILLLHSWFSILALGLEPGDHQGFIKWAVIDTLLPLALSSTAYAMWRRPN